MEKEQVAVDEAVETVAEQNTRAYSKTVWNESTPITADKLNKIENGIANALDTTTGGTVKGKLTVKGNIQLDDGNLYSNKNGGNKAVIEVLSGDKNGSGVVYSGGALTVLAGGESGSVVAQNMTNTEEHAVVSADQGVILYANLQNGWENRKTVELTKGGRFKLNNNSLELSPNNSGYARIGLDGDTQDVYISNINNNWFRLKGDKTITYGGHKVYTAFDKPTPAEIGALPISGGTLTGGIGVPGESTFYNDTYVDPWHGTGCVIKASGNVGIGGSLKVNGKLEVGEDIKSPVFEARTDFIINRHGFSSFYTNNQNGALIHCDKNSSNITLADGKMVYANPNGNIEIGPQNTQHCHIYTDRPSFYFNKELIVNGNRVYHTGNKPTAGDIGALPLSGGTLTGAISVPGENRFYSGTYTDPWHGVGCAIKASGNVAVQGLMRLNNNSEAVFHEVCNARDIGLYLNNNNWGIYDYQNSRTILRYNMDGDRVEIQGRRAATWEGSNPTHHMFRYGSGLGGANGYITFSY